jgi:hypothetical protein
LAFIFVLGLPGLLAYASYVYRKKWLQLPIWVINSLLKDLYAN